MTILATWRLLCLLIISSPRVFSANNICPATENYTVTSTETYTEPVIVNTYTWCMQIPPRCPKTRTEMRQRYRIKTEVKSRTVNACCEGYKIIPHDDEEAGIRCEPSCEKCVSGVCISPNQCQCIPGYHGDSCETACPPGTWGTQCKEKCSCTEDVPCDPVNGHCVCPPGLRGQMCNESCPSDHWGPECRFLCDCKNSMSKCHPETGQCMNDATISVDNGTSHQNSDEDNSVTVNFTIVELNGEPSHIWQTTESSAKEELVTANEILATTDNSDKPKNADPAGVSTLNHSKIRTQAQGDENSSTTRPVIVLVSVPERRRNLENDRGKFAMKNPYARHVDDNISIHHVIQPKTDYAKNLHNDVQSVPISLDIALIVVASIVSLGLTSVAVVMVLHMRSKLLETTRISIYEEGKAKSQENSGGTRISSIVASTLPQTPVRMGPLFTSTLEPRTMIPADSIELSNNYANGAATIDRRVSSGNLHGLLQDDHYDRPPSTRIRLQSDIDSNVEHLYDEIPLQSSPVSCHRNA